MRYSIGDKVEVNDSELGWVPGTIIKFDRAGQPIIHFRDGTALEVPAAAVRPEQRQDKPVGRSVTESARNASAARE